LDDDENRYAAPIWNAIDTDPNEIISGKSQSRLIQAATNETPLRVSISKQAYDIP
jgi:hypothetical protein